MAGPELKQTNSKILNWKVYIQNRRHGPLHSEGKNVGLGDDDVLDFDDDISMPREEEGDGEEEGAGGDGSDDSEVDEPPVGEG